MTSDTNDKVVARRQWIQLVTGPPLRGSDMNSFVSYGGKRIK